VSQPVKIERTPALILSGIADPTALARELSRRSGLDELVRLIDSQFRTRSAQLKARAALVGVETLLRQRPHVGTEALAASLERIRAGAHEFRELRLLAMARTAGLPLGAELTAEALRLIGGDGIATADRLGLPEDAPVEQVRSQALDYVLSWRTRSENPFTSRDTAEVCQTVLRSCEAILAQLKDDSGAYTTAHLVLRPEPRGGAGDESQNQRHTGKRELQQQEDLEVDYLFAGADHNGADDDPDAGVNHQDAQ
jgi:hypothetical protein